MKEVTFSKKAIGWVTAALIFGLLFTYSAYRGDRPRLLVVATGSPGGVYYPLGGAIPGLTSDFIGLAILVGVFLFHRSSMKGEEVNATSS